MTLEALKPAGALPMLSAHGDERGLTTKVEALGHVECAVVPDVLSYVQVDDTRNALYDVQVKSHQELGVERLMRTDEVCVMWLLKKYDPYSFILDAVGEQRRQLNGLPAHGPAPVPCAPVAAECPSS